MGELNVSIVTYHTPIEELGAVLKCLKSDLVEKIYLIDNSRQKSIRDWCETHGVVYIPSENIGYGAAHNIALSKTLSQNIPFHLVINSDLSFSPIEIEKMISKMKEDRDIGLLHPRILGTDGKDQYTVRMLPTPLDLFLRRFVPNVIGAKRRDRYLLKHIDHQKEFQIPYVQGSFMMLRTDALNDIGKFDERFFMYPEDIDLSRRISEKWKVLYYPVTIVIHKHKAASYHLWKMTKIHIFNMIKYFNKWGWFFDAYRRAVNKKLKYKQ